MALPFPIGWCNMVGLFSFQLKMQFIKESLTSFRQSFLLMLSNIYGFLIGHSQQARELYFQTLWFCRKQLSFLHRDFPFCGLAWYSVYSFMLSLVHFRPRPTGSMICIGVMCIGGQCAGFCESLRIRTNLNQLHGPISWSFWRGNDFSRGVGIIKKIIFPWNDVWAGYQEEVVVTWTWGNELLFSRLDEQETSAHFSHLSFHLKSGGTQVHLDCSG